MPSKTLVLTSCCKEKLNHAAPARDLYQGKLFQLVRKYAEENKFDWRVLSAKHGLIDPGQVIEPYDLQIRGRAQIEPLQGMVLPALFEIANNYERIVVIMGSQYLKVVNPILQRQGQWKLARDVKVEVIHDERGIGGLLQQVHRLIAAAWVTRTDEAHREAADAINGHGQAGFYTRNHFPARCLRCPDKSCEFDPKRKAALPNGSDNPACTPCDYCITWDDGIPDQFPCSQCGERGHLRRLKYAIFCDNCHKVHQQLDGKEPMTEQPNPEKKTEETNTEPEPSEFGRICGGCNKPIKPGTKNMVQDPHTGRWFHAEHYSMDERHQEDAGDRYECIACSKEFPETEMHRDRDGETWCKACWAAEHPRKPRARPSCAKCSRPSSHLEKCAILDKSYCKKCMPEGFLTPIPDGAAKDCNLWSKQEWIDFLSEEREGSMQFYEREIDDLKVTCFLLGVKPATDDRADLVLALQDFYAGEKEEEKSIREQINELGGLKEGFVEEKPGLEVPMCPVCNLPQTREIYPADEGFKRCTCKSPGNLGWAGTYLYNKIFAEHPDEIMKLLSKDEREKMNVLGEVLEDA